MRILEAQQVELQDVVGNQADLIFVSAGYEIRSSSMAKLLGRDCARKKIALGFNDRPILARSINEKILKRLGYALIPSDGGSGSIVEGALVEALAEKRKAGVVKLLVDYTCMTRVWYSSVVSILREEREFSGVVEVFFCYIPSRFARPKTAVPNIHIGPIPGFCHLQLPTNKTALVIGLGYEAHQASGLVDYVEAAETYAFLAEPSLDPRFAEVVKRNNHDLLRRIGSDHVVRYPLVDLRATEALLASLCSGLWKEYRVILAPLGPKPFALLCLLFAARYPFLDVWRVSAGAGGNVYDRQPGGAPLILKVTFSSEEDA